MIPKGLPKTVKPQFNVLNILNVSMLVNSIREKWKLENFWISFRLLFEMLFLKPCFLSPVSHLSKSPKFYKESSHMTENMLCCQQCFGQIAQLSFSATGGRDKRKGRDVSWQKGLFSYLLLRWCPFVIFGKICYIQHQSVQQHFFTLTTCFCT